MNKAIKSKLVTLLSIVIMVSTFTACGNKTTTPTPAKTTPAPVVYDLGVSPDEFKSRWNGTATLGQKPELKIQDSPGTGGTDNTTYTLSKNITMTVYILKDKGKVRDLVIKSNPTKMDDAETETMGMIYFLAMRTAEPEITEQETTQITDEFGTNINPGFDKTVVKRNTGFELKADTSLIQFIVKNKDAFPKTTTPAK